MCPTPSDVVYLSLAEWHSLLPLLRHGCVERETTAGALVRGSMTVSDNSDLPRVWLSWAWEEMQPGVVVQQDLQAIRSNARILDARGMPLTTVAQFQALQTVMFRLTWWKHVDLEILKHEGSPVHRVLLPPLQ